MHLLTSRSATIENIKSLSGKRLIVGKPEGYSSAAAVKLLCESGVDPTSVQMKHVRYTDLKLEMLQARQADAMLTADK